MEIEQQKRNSMLIVKEYGNDGPRKVVLKLKLRWDTTIDYAEFNADFKSVLIFFIFSIHPDMQTKILTSTILENLFLYPLSIPRKRANFTL